ncbi:MAG: HAMP domain-containing sensor histidine kinase [Lysinibacillus sp.]
MNTLYRKFSGAALLILVASLGIGFALANIIYFTVAKEKIDAQNVETAEGIAEMLFYDHYDEVLQSMAKIGYQLIIVNKDGERSVYGEAFSNDQLPQSAIDFVLSGEVYHGMENFSGSFLMMGHFSNDAENTVGVPFKMNNEQYALFLRPNNQSLFSDMHAILVGFIVAVAAVSLTGVFLMTRQIFRPIAQLTEATVAIARENYNYTLDIKRNDEIGQLADSFRTMQQQLSHNHESTKAFISNVSHDFQSPLMNIQGYAELLQNGITKEERIEYSSIIGRESKRLSNLTKQLLLLTSLDQSAYPLQKQSIRLDEQLREMIHKYRWRITECEIDLSYKLSEVTVVVDRELMMNVWDNILSNALKYTESGGQIEISCEKVDSTFVVKCRDSGVGLSADEAAQVFERFYRVDEARKKDGTGLGLAISREIVELHGGRIEVDSVLGEGSTFKVTLPI